VDASYPSPFIMLILNFRTARWDRSAGFYWRNRSDRATRCFGLHRPARTTR